MIKIPEAGETFLGDDGTVSTILPANYGQDCEASEGELEEYAEYIGIDPAKEPELMWIAKEGLRAPLPEGWRACLTNDNEIYYFNFQSGNSLWDHPMDEQYREMVVAERAKHRSGGSGGAGGKSSLAASLTGGGSGGGPAARAGTTKALTNSLFLEPSATVSGSLSASTESFLPLDGGASAPLPAPDVSDILNLASVASPFGSGGAKGAPVPFKLKEAEAALRKRLEEQSEAQLRSLRVDYGKKEDAERQRLEEAKTRLQKELDNAWAREDPNAPSSCGSSNNDNISRASAATQRRLQTAREVKQIENSWQTRLRDVSNRVKELQQRVDTQQQALQRSIYQSPEELKMSLEARNVAEVAQLREAARKQNEVALQRVKNEHAAEQAAAAARSAETVAAAERLAESTTAQKVQERQTQNTAMLAALQAAVEAKQAELAAKVDVAAAAPIKTAEVLPTQVRLSEQDKAAIAAAQAAAEAEVAQAKQTHTLALTRLKEEYDGKKRQKEAAMLQSSNTVGGTSHNNSNIVLNSSRMSSALQTPTHGPSNTTSNNSSFSVNAISPGEQLKLDEEDQRLKEEAEKAAHIFEEETELMVANRKAGRPLTAAPLPAAAVNVSADAVAALGRTATQNQRARDAENARHSMTIKQLEAKHEQAVRLIKTQHEKAITAAAAAAAPPSSASPSSSAAPAAPFNPRQHPSFTAQLNARKRSWLRDHPAPSNEMPTLTPIPALPTTTMSSTMAAATMPDPEEQTKIVKTRLAQTRDELRHKFDREMQALQREKEDEIAAWQTNYRVTRLEEVQRAVEMFRQEQDKEMEQAKAKAKEQAAEAAAAADAAAAAASGCKEAEATATVAAANARLQRLQSSLQALEDAAASNSKKSAASMAALASEIAQLEATLRSLTAEIDAEEEKKQRIQLQISTTAATAVTEVDAETEEMRDKHGKVQQALTPSPDVTSTALFIADAEAAAEEAALRTRWTTLLASLRAAVQQERESFERALAEGGSSAAATTTTTTANSLPPTAPVAPNTATTMSAGPPYPSSSQVGGGAANTSSTYLGFATPLQRPPLSSAGSDYRTYCAEGPGGGLNPGVRLFMPPSSQQVAQLQQPQPQPSWGNSSGAVLSNCGFARYPDPATGVHYQRNSTANLSGLGGNSAVDSVSQTHTALPMPCYADFDDSSRFFPPSQLPSPPVASAALVQRRNDNSGVEDQAMRLTALQEAVRERRHELRAQRREMEQLREEWKKDMRECKEHNDTVQARRLRRVKEVLEERARRLNEEVLEAKAVQYEVQNEVRRYCQWAQQQQQVGPSTTTAASHFSGDDYEEDASARVRQPSTNEGASPTANVVGLLEGIVARTERLEKLLLRNTRFPNDASPSPGRDSAHR